MNTFDIINGVFEKYSVNGLMDDIRFASVIVKLSTYVDRLVGASKDNCFAAFALLDTDADGYIDAETFKIWWNKQDKYDDITGEKANKILRAYNLYKKYSFDKRMIIHGFLRFAKDLNIKATEDDFDEIDTNDDGVIDFVEFSRWLGWF